MRPGRSDRQTFVYVVEAQNGVIKIGVSCSPKSRALAIHQHSPVPCRLIAALPGETKDERRLHRRFAEQRSHCEWFRIEGPVAEFVSFVRGTGVDRVPDWDELVFPAANERRAAATARQKALWADAEYRRAMIISRRVELALNKLIRPGLPRPNLGHERSRLTAQFAAEYDAKFALPTAAPTARSEKALAS
jgi:hypothetical protein